MDVRDLMSVSRAAKELGVSRQRVYELVGKGVLAGCRIDGILFVFASAVRSRKGFQVGRK